MSWVRLGNQRLMSEQVVGSDGLRSQMPKIIGAQITEMLEEMAAKAKSDEDAVVRWPTVDIEVRQDRGAMIPTILLRTTVEAERDDAKQAFKILGGALARREAEKRRGS